MKKTSQCPNCKALGRDRSQDNLVQFDDGSYCFSCGYRENGDKLFKLRKRKETRGTLPSLPSDVTDDLPLKCLDWLNSYNLTTDEISKFLWTEKYERLIYPVFDLSGNLVMTSGRKFPSDSEKHSKYRSEGEVLKVYHFIGKPSAGIILTEDVVSAIKVGRQYYAMPIWGAQIPLERIRTLATMFSELWIWLDPDKAKYSLKVRAEAAPYFDLVRSIITTKDPKCYSDEEIKEILNGNTSGL